MTSQTLPHPPYVADCQRCTHPLDAHHSMQAFTDRIVRFCADCQRAGKDCKAGGKRK